LQKNNTTFTDGVVNKQQELITPVVPLNHERHPIKLHEHVRKFHGVLKELRNYHAYSLAFVP
jgi:hypothetical protein